MAGTTKWQDWTSFALGLWLAVSPWVAGYSEDPVSTSNAVFVGITLAVGSHVGIGLDEVSTDWLNLAAGFWLMLAPFVLDFVPAPVPTSNCIAVGAFVAALAASALELDRGFGRWWQRRSTHIRV
jgi:SPW repeat